ncbi:flavin reductase [Nocardia sp. NPDC050697]|uniref:flavin reductase family protein n=1 Tax=Nocardia sp. NPDC050697 TaxID=3155158 RepID=UPI0033DEAFA2
MNHDVGHAHRLLAPRIAYLIGTKDAEGLADLIPVSNVTSVSTAPQQLAIAVLKKWRTCENLFGAEGFTVSVPVAGQLDGVWKLGAKYSGFSVTEPAEKLATCGLQLDLNASPYGPVLLTGIGWASCRLRERLDFGGDHGVFIGEVGDVWFNTEHLTSDGTPKTVTRPLMQQTGNLFTTAADELVEIPYFSSADGN